MNARQRVLERFGVKTYTPLEAIEAVEKHDDIWHNPREGFLERVLERSLPNLFHQFLNSWPDARIKWLPSVKDRIAYEVRVRYKNWEQTFCFDGALYFDDKTAFIAGVMEWVQNLSEWFDEEEQSGRPWWTLPRDREQTTFTYTAATRMHGKLYTSMNSKLGWVKKRGGRWCWFQTPSVYRDDWPVKEHKQGIAGTLEDAQAKVEEGWQT